MGWKLTTQTREGYWQGAIDLIRPIFVEKGFTVPDVHVSIGFPSKSALSRKHQRVGECWYVGSDNRPQIFLSPLIAAPIRIADVLVHELAHTVAGKEAKHGPAFKRVALAVGLTGKMTATEAGEDLKVRLLDILSILGPAPHASLTAGELKGKVQGTRLLKGICPGCGYVIRVTQKWVDEGWPHCNGCGMDFVGEGQKSLDIPEVGE